MAQIYNVRGRCVRRSPNARLLIDYRTRAGLRVLKVIVARKRGTRAGIMTVIYGDRMRGVHEFAAFETAIMWAQRRRSWRLVLLRRSRARVIFEGEEVARKRGSASGPERRTRERSHPKPGHTAHSVRERNMEIKIPRNGQELDDMRFSVLAWPDGRGIANSEFAELIGVPLRTYWDWLNADPLPKWKGRAARDAAIEELVRRSRSSWHGAR